MDQEKNSSLKRNLNNRHIQLIAIGGCIGTGLFLGSGSTIHLAGPSIILIYCLIGSMIFLVMRALGEILLSNLKYKSFLDFISELLGPYAGYVLGWSYWLCWVAIGIADLIAISGYTKMFFPLLPSWIPAFLCIILFYSLNRLNVRLFGEMEFAFAVIKVIAICVLVIVGGIFILTAFKTPTGQVTSLVNIFNHGNVFPNGIQGFLAGFQSATFAFIGVELVGTVAAESKDPLKTLPKAINHIPIRILMFYVLSVMVIMSVISWESIDPSKSPFIILFLFAGFPAAAALVYIVVMTSAASSTNSGIFSTSRMLYGLALLQKAPSFLTKLSNASIPINGLRLSCIFLFISVFLLLIGNQNIVDTFIMVTSVATIIWIFTLFLILISYIKYRQKYTERHNQSCFKLPGGLFSCVICLLFLLATVLTLFLQENTRIALYIGAVWFCFISFTYLLVPSNIKHRWKEIIARKVN